MSRACPHCSHKLAADAAYCSACGATITPPAVILHTLRRAATGPTTRLTVPRAHGGQRHDAHDAQAVVVGLVGLVFVITFVLGYANALAALGLSALSFGALLIPLIGGMLAEAAWVQGRWWRGGWGMLLWQAVIWGIALVRLFG